MTTFESLIIEAVAQRCSVKKMFLEILAKFTGKHLCQSLFFNKVAGAAWLQLQVATSLISISPINFFQKFTLDPKLCALF